MASFSFITAVFFAFASFQLSVASDATSRFTKHADPFLGKVVSTRSSVKEEVEEVLTSKYRADNTERLKLLEEELSPTYWAMPKTTRGNLGVAAARQLLHRHFLRARAWLVKGLAPDGDASNATSPVTILDASAGAVKEMFEQRLRGRGLDLQEVALLAAMIENQVHQDAVARLRQAWRAESLLSNATIGMHKMEEVLDVYMTSYIIHAKGGLKPSNVKKALKQVGKVYPKWNATQSFVRSTLRRSLPHRRQELTFWDAELVVVEISESYGKFQYGECHDLKMDLLAIEGKPGRVALRDFYGEAVRAGKYQFGESVAYMKHSGILDTSDAKNPSLIIPNYIESPSQYIASSDAYALTCQDECEQIMSQVEQKIAAPYATPDQISAAVQSVPSDTQPERSEGLSPMLLLRLEEIARVDSRDGTRQVALHGRLFAQWLHNAYPRECPYPHTSKDGVEFLLPSEFNARHGKDAAYATELEMKQFASLDISALEAGQSDDNLPWDPTEELLAPKVMPVTPLVPTFLVPYFQAAGCITVLLMLLSNLAILQGLPKASAGLDKAAAMKC